MEFLTILKERNSLLMYFGAINLLAAILFIILSFTTKVDVMGVNAWYKPTKFALATFFLAWTMGWFMGYLEQGRYLSIVNWVLIITLAFEVIYIGLQAGRGQLSHYNISTPFYSFLYSMMALAASAATIAVAYIGIQFFKQDLPNLPDYYLWAIRLGIILFVIFSFEGFVMGSRMTHTIGGPDGGEGLPFLNWSRQYGDPRIAHFIGMHAMQVLPILAYYLLKDVKWTIIMAILYSLMAFYVLAQALWGRPLV